MIVHASTIIFNIFLFIFQRDDMTSTGQASSLTNMFDPHIYACQSLVGSNSNSNPTVQSIVSDAQQKVPSPQLSPQKNRNPLQTSGTSTPQRKQSQPEDGYLREISVVAESGNSEVTTTTHLMQNAGSGASSTNNSRKTSTVSDLTSSEHTPDNTILTPKTGQDSTGGNEQQVFTATPTSAFEAPQAKPSPVRKLSRFLVSPTVIETINHELVVVPEGTHAPASSPQQVEAQAVEMNINEENCLKSDLPEAELQPQQSSGFRMPETLEQLKIELENITHAHVSTKAKEAQQLMLEKAQNMENEDSQEPISEAQLESGAECPSIDAAGSITTGDNTSVYNSRRTSADMNTNPTDLTSTASGILELEENLVNEPVQMAMDDASAPKVTLPVQQQMSIDT